MMSNKHARLERIAKLLRTCQKRLECDIEDVDAWFSKGVILAELKKYKQALYCLNQVTKREIDYPSAWRLKATIYALAGHERMSQLCKEVAKRLRPPENGNSFEGDRAREASPSVSVY
jgi:tetratricopeptide (TPR) repeat protein